MNRVLLYSTYFIGALFCLGVILFIIDHTFLRNRLSYKDKERGCALMGCAGMLFAILVIVVSFLDRGCSSSSGPRLPSGPSLPPPVPVPPLR